MQLVLLVLLLLLQLSGPAQAGFLVPLIAGAVFAASTAGVILTFALNVAFSIGLSFLASKLLAKKPLTAKTPGGVELDIRVEANVPQSLILGRAVTAGSQVAAETYGKRGQIDNSDLIEIIGIADHECEGLVTQFVEGQEVDLTDTATTRGFTVDGYDGKLALKFFDGTQTAADAFAVAALGSHSERPWTAAMVGRGRSYIRTHSIFHKELVPGRLRWRFVVNGKPLYDPRFDTTVGGSGPQRFNDIDTHVFTRNLAVMVYNILRGIRVKDADGNLVHFYGLKDTAAANLPLSNWFAAMNECDVVIEGEPQYHGGAEISVDTEPHAAIKELSKAMDARLTERGGIYKLYVGAPGLPVFTINDGSLRADEGDDFRPLRGLEQRVNYVTGTYTSPEDGWVPKVAPARGNSVWELEDGRRLDAEIDAPMVQSDAHMQRLMQQLLFRNRRQRRHVIPLGPEQFGVEPGDVGEWDSERNSYEDKLFEVDAVDYFPNLAIRVAITETDPSDFDFDFETDLLDSPVGSIVQDRPAPKIIDDFSAEPYLHEGDTGQKRPAIRLFWTPPETADGDPDDDIIGVIVQIRRAAIPLEVVDYSFEGEEAVAAGEGIILASLAADTEYEVRARFKVSSGIESTFSLWIPVTTPAAGTITQADFDAEFQALIQWATENVPADLFTIRNDLDEIATALNTQITVMRENAGHINIGVGERFEASEAAVELVATAAATANSAISALLVNLFAVTEAGEAELNVRFIAASAPEGVVASIAIEARATTDDAFGAAGIYIDAGVTDLGGGSRVRLVGGSVQVENPTTGLILDMLLLQVSDEPVEIEIVDGEVQADLSQRQIAHYTLVNDDIEIQHPLGARPGLSWTHTLEIAAPGGFLIDFNPAFILPPYPTVSDTAGDITVLRGEVVKTQTGVKSIIYSVGTGQTIPPEENLWSWLQEIGATADARSTIDFASADCYDPGVDAQKIFDLSGSNNFWHRGTGTGSDSRDPTFHGTPGGLSESEYFEFDGGDQFVGGTDGTDVSFADDDHQNNAEWSWLGVVQVPADFGLTGKVFLFATAKAIVLDGIQTRIGTSFYLIESSINDTLELLIEVTESGGGGVTYVNTFSPGIDLADLANTPLFVAVTFDEAMVNGATVQFNGTRVTDHSAYVSPSAAGVIAKDYTIGKRNITTTGGNEFSLAGTKQHCAHWAGRKITNSELDALYAIMKARRFTSML